MHRVAYAHFASRLRELPRDATCADLSATLAEYFAGDIDLRDRMLAAVGELPSEAEWMQGLFRVCRVLKAEQPRFVEALFWDDMVMYDR